MIDKKTETEEKAVESIDQLPEGANPNNSESLTLEQLAEMFKQRFNDKKQLLLEANQRLAFDLKNIHDSEANMKLDQPVAIRLAGQMEELQISYNSVKPKNKDINPD